MAKVHNSKLRSPLVLSADKWREWLNTGVDVKDRLKLGAHPDEILQACKIKPDFNKTKTNKNQELYLQPWQEPEFPEGLF
jgi:putative SOS response-associated peptidase YedK